MRTTIFDPLVEYRSKWSIYCGTVGMRLRDAGHLTALHGRFAGTFTATLTWRCLMSPRRVVAAVPALGVSPTWDQACDAFLRRDLAPGTLRVYELTLRAVQAHLRAVVLADVDAVDLSRSLTEAYPQVSAASWNRAVATVRSFWSFAGRNGWVQPDAVQALERRRVVEDHGRSMSRAEVERILTRRDVDVRDRALWRMLYETAARANEVLGLNVEDVDLTAKRAVTVRKGGDRDVLHFQTGSARLLPKVIAGRSEGPLFIALRPPMQSRAPANTDLDPATGRARLSYRRAAEVFSAAADGRTLHQIRHSAITHLAEDGVPLPLLMAKSRHESLRTLQRYARPSADAVSALTAAHDPASRRRT